MNQKFTGCLLQKFPAARALPAVSGAACLWPQGNYRDHSFTFTGLHSLQQERYESAFSRVTNLPFNSSFYNLGTAASRENIASDFSKISLISCMARVNFSFKEKYLLTLATRWDGSSKLAPGHKWASFPSASLAWRLSEESFLKGIALVNDLKLRLSAGVAGNNNNNINAYGTQMNLSTFYDFNGALALGYTPNRLPNPELTWERTREYDLGLDYAVLSGRISGSVDVYDKLSEGLIMDRDVAMENGWGAGGAFKILRPIPSRALLLNEATFEQNPGY